MRNGYDDSKTIDRIDNDRGYSPENCRWTDVVGQQRNKRNTHWVTVDGRRVSMAEAAELLGVKYTTLRRRLNNYGASSMEAGYAGSYGWGELKSIAATRSA